MILIGDVNPLDHLIAHEANDTAYIDLEELGCAKMQNPNRWSTTFGPGWAAGFRISYSSLSNPNPFLFIAVSRDYCGRGDFSNYGLSHFVPFSPISPHNCVFRVAAACSGYDACEVLLTLETRKYVGSGKTGTKSHNSTTQKIPSRDHRHAAEPLKSPAVLENADLEDFTSTVTMLST